MKFSTDLKDSVNKVRLSIYMCWYTNQKKWKWCRFKSQVFTVAKEIKNSISKFKIIITKSTVPVTTGDEIEKIIIKGKVSKKLFSVVSNPEFLKRR